MQPEVVPENHFGLHPELQALVHDVNVLPTASCL